MGVEVVVGDGEVEALIFNYLKSYSVCEKEGMKWGVFQRTPHLKHSDKVSRKAKLIKIALGGMTLSFGLTLVVILWP